MPWVFAFVLGMAFLLLLVSFRSLVIPITAICLNLLSVGAAYGILVWVFQDGHLEGPLGFESIGSITSWLPLFLFVVLFGLSMDYHVFILTRIREAYDRGMSTEAAVSHGLRTTAGVVTSAAAVMVAVFGIFATLSFLEFKELGVGLATAILIDATIIRGVLLPATMKLLGERNWYLPRWLEWLPKMGSRARARGFALPRGVGMAAKVRTRRRGKAGAGTGGPRPPYAAGRRGRGARLTARLSSLAPPWLAALGRLVPRIPAEVAVGASVSLLRDLGGHRGRLLLARLGLARSGAVLACRRLALVAAGPARPAAQPGDAGGLLARPLAELDPHWAIRRRLFWPVWMVIGLGVAFAPLLLPRRQGADLRSHGERELTERVETLTETRRGALDVQAAELRRIERDLHDGAQARLVALSMQLGRAEEGLADRPEIAALVRQARAEATAANAELRDLARGIAPPVLADRGLAAAAESLGNRAPVPVTVDAALGHGRRRWWRAPPTSSSPSRSPMSPSARGRRVPR